MPRARRTLSTSLDEALFRQAEKQIPSKAVPEGWPRGMSRRQQHVDSSSLLIRDVDQLVESTVITPLLESSASDAKVGSVMEDAGSSQKKKLFVLTGKRGVGKSSSMLQAVVTAREKGILTMYMPSARVWTHGDGFFAASAVEGLSPVVDGPSAIRFYDRPGQTKVLLQSFLAAHGKTLGSIPLRVESEFRANNPSLKTVQDVVRRGVEALDDIDSDWRSNPQLGGDSLSHLMKELAVQSEVPVLIAIDEYEAFLGLSSLVSKDKRCPHANCIRVVSENFGRGAIANTAASLTRGAVLVSLSKSHGITDWRPSRVRGTADYPVTDDVRKDPRGLLWLKYLGKLQNAKTEADIAGNLGADWKFDPVAVAAAKSARFTRFINIPEWSHSEAEQLVNQFERSKIFPSFKKEHRDRLILLAGGRSDLLHQLFMGA